MTKEQDVEPQADTPVPLVWARPNDVGPRLETERTSESHRTITVRVDRPDDYHTVALVRRDGTAPTADLAPLFAAYAVYYSAPHGPEREHASYDVLDAVRALRDGGTR